ncbi:virion structural protein [Xanthomonas phage Mallos]|uniref:Virion structural protein n=1 Tax=Xanthomonas phage Mallos TaxID=2939131 RepID=A0A9E7J6D5_9CAUD|nr:virion structural protein [Xanthomonas phage Mallos]URA07139.1 virion structural protein [Xanthomonas phage Mallos]
MATFDYAGLKLEVDELLAEFGTDCQIKRELPGTVDPVTGVPSGGNEQVTNVLGVLVSYEEKLVDGETIMRGDRQALVQATVEPLFGDTFVELGGSWSVVNVQAVNPAGVALVYILQVRR